MPNLECEKEMNKDKIFKDGREIKETSKQCWCGHLANLDHIASTYRRDGNKTIVYKCDNNHRVFFEIDDKERYWGKLSSDEQERELKSQKRKEKFGRKKEMQEIEERIDENRE